MKCARCKKKYDDELPICPYCGKYSEEAPEKKPLRNRTAFTALVYVSVAVTVASVICLGALLVIRRVQKGHYDKGQALLEKGEPLESIVEFKRAGTYSNARDLHELTYKYCLACQLMEDEDWKEAHDLLCDVQEIDESFLDTAGKIHYIEHCPQSPVTFSLAQIQSVPRSNVQVKNLLGEKVSVISFTRGWSYSNHGRPDLVISLQVGSFSSGIVLAAGADSRYKGDLSTIIVPSTGQRFETTGSSYNYHFTVSDASIIYRPTLPDGSWGRDPVFGSLILTIAVSPK